MPVLVTSKFDENTIKNERASLETPFSYYKSMENFLDAQGHPTPKAVVRSGWNLNSFKILCLSSLPASLTKIRSKLKALAWRHRFPHYKSMGAFCCLNHSFDGICSKTLKQPFPHPTDDTYKISSRLDNWSWRFHNKSIENLICPPGRVTPKWLIRSGLNSDVRDFMPVLVTSKFDEDPIKNELERVFMKHYAPNI